MNNTVATAILAGARGHMIANFKFSSTLPGDCVAVAMSWHNDQRFGTVIVPEPLVEVLRDEGVPNPIGAIPISSALSLALFLAMRAFIPLYLTGEQDVWNEDWGQLVTD